MEFKRKCNPKKMMFLKRMKKKSSFAEEKETLFFFCHSLQLYSHLFLNEQFPEIPKLMRHEEVWSYEPSNFR